MSDSWLDHIPSREREKIRKRMRSPEAYAALREKVKGPEDLEREMERNEKMAELKFHLESEPTFQDRLRLEVVRDIENQGIEHVIEGHPLDAESTKALERGAFRLTVSSHPKTYEDVLMLLPEGAVQEKIPIRSAVSERYLSGLSSQ